MSGRNINIYLQEDLHRRLKPWIKERKVSKFINEAVAEKLDKEKKISKEKLIAGYKSAAKSKIVREEDKIWEGTIEDGIEDE